MNDKKLLYNEIRRIKHIAIAMGFYYAGDEKGGMAKAAELEKQISDTEKKVKDFLFGEAKEDL